MPKFKKKPVEIEAWPFDGTYASAQVIMRACQDENISYSSGREIGVEGWMHIVTLEGVMSASPGDWIIRGVKGEFYPCKPDIFEKTYDRVEG